ncbi:MAG: peptidase C25 [Thermoplasmata archaeon]|nr:MAG: peptidase C25 [Thermoplasmata archaeon]
MVNGGWVFAENKDIKNIFETIHLSNPSITKFSDSILIEVKEANSYLYLPGNPILPVYTKTYKFPFGTKIDNIDIAFSGKTKWFLSKDIIHAPTPITYLDGEKLMGKVITFSEDFYPRFLSRYNIGVGIEDNQHVIFVTIYCYPIQYIPSDNAIVSYNKIDVHLSYTLPEEPIYFPDEYDLLIVAPNSFLDALQPLVDHKNSIDVKTKLVSTEDIYNGIYFPVEGRDSAEQLKYFIKNAIENWGIEYVLLVGGRSGGIYHEKWLIPVRYSHLNDGGESSFLSDLYFADIYKYKDGEVVFEDWDSNGDGIFAEWRNKHASPEDTLDLYPDVAIGRLPCKKIDEVETMVNKIIKYEDNTYGADWFKRMIVVGGDSAPGDPYYEGEEENAKALEYMKGFQPVKLWASDGSLKGPEDVISKIDEGAGFLFFDGHGNPATWGTHPPNDDKTWITGLNNKDMLELDNGYKLPVCVVGGCHNGQFNVSLWNIPRDILKYGIRGYFFKPPYKFYYMEWVPRCWAWQLASRPNGGSIATIAYAGLDWFAEGNYDNDSIPDCIQYYSGYFNVNFFKNYGQNNETILGCTFTRTINDYIKQHPPMDYYLDCKTVEEITLFGDPSLQIGGIPR